MDTCAGCRRVEERFGIRCWIRQAQHPYASNKIPGTLLVRTKNALKQKGDTQHNRHRHTILPKKKKKEKTKCMYSSGKYLSRSILFWSDCENLPACFLQYAWYLVRGTTICTPTFFLDRHNKKTARFNGQAWRLNKSSCNSGNSTRQVLIHSYTAPWT